MEQILTLKIPYGSGDMEDYIYPVILQDDKDLVLIDCGYIGFLSQIEKALEEQGLCADKLTKIVITHHDHDHMGSLAALKRKYPHIQVVAGEIEAPFISGEKKSLRLTQAEQAQETLPKEQKPFGLAFCQLLRSLEPVPVDMVVKDGDFLQWGGGCKIIFTPGHTPGHISLYLEKYKIMVTGDAAVVQNGELAVANPEFVLNLTDAAISLQRLKDYKADTYICYHGGIYRPVHL